MRDQDYISEARAVAKSIWEAKAKLDQLKAEWVALDYANDLADGTDANAGYTAQDVSAVVNTTNAALDSLLSSGHATNLAKLL